MKYVCLCGFEYNETIGNPRNGIDPGTLWEDVPEDFTCPLCALGKDAFAKE
jgi:rubredoxin-NAD+ reductase